MLKLPTVEIDSRKGTGQSPSVLSMINDAMAKYGFVGVRDIAFSEDLRREVLSFANTYFSKDRTEKLADASAQTHIVRGYSGPGSDYLSKTQNETGKDLVEKFVIGPERDEVFLSTVPKTYRELYGHNVWPDIPGFKETYLKYENYLESLATILASLFDESLDLREEFLVNHISHSPNNIRLNHYTYIGAEEKNPIHLGAHTDFGLFTILLTDGKPGLEVKVGVEWQEISCDPRAFIVNAGDVLAMLTNDHWLASLHRVKPPLRSGVIKRTSIPYFVDGNHDLKISCLPGFCDSENPWKYHECTVEEHFTNKVNTMRFGTDVRFQQTRQAD